MLGNEGKSVNVISQKDSLPDNGIYVGEAKTNEDIFFWADKVDEGTLAAGGASFFNALLSKKFPLKHQNRQRVQLSSPLLLISGTTFQKNVHRIRDYSHAVSYMPGPIFNSQQIVDSDFQEWAKDIAEKLSKYNKAIIAVDNSNNERTDPNLLREKKAMITELVLRKATVKEVLIEGGSTAYSIVQKIGWKSFIPTEELEQGIVRMQVKGMADLHLTIKPGSYEWPVEWNFNDISL
jgi:uncharacterized protein YgbK (DUF1537 family)